MSPMLPSCESDASGIPAAKLKFHKNRGSGSKIVKVMVHYTDLVVGLIWYGWRVYCNFAKVCPGAEE